MLNQLEEKFWRNLDYQNYEPRNELQIFVTKSSSAGVMFPIKSLMDEHMEKNEL